MRRVDRPYVGLEPVEEDRRGTLPARLLADDAVTLPLSGSQDEAVIAARIEAATGLAVQFVGAARAYAIETVEPAVDRLGHPAPDDLGKRLAAERAVALAPLQAVRLHRLHDLKSHR